MKSSELGGSTSKVEVTNISMSGIWLLIREREYFLPYNDFPWFNDAKLSEIQNVKLLHPHHLYWPDLDIDLELESILNVKKYPFIYH